MLRERIEPQLIGNHIWQHLFERCLDQRIDRLGINATAHQPFGFNKIGANDPTLLFVLDHGQLDRHTGRAEILDRMPVTAVPNLTTLFWGVKILSSLNDFSEAEKSRPTSSH